MPPAWLARSRAKPSFQGIRAGTCSRVPWEAATLAPLTCKPSMAANWPQICRSGVCPRRNTSLRIFSIASRRNGSSSSRESIWKQARVSSSTPSARIKRKRRSPSPVISKPLARGAGARSWASASSPESPRSCWLFEPGGWLDRRWSVATKKFWGRAIKRRGRGPWQGGKPLPRSTTDP